MFLLDIVCKRKNLELNLKAPWRVSSGLTSLTSYVLKFRQVPLFEELSDACLLSAINRIAAYRDIPTTVFHIVVQNSGHH